MIILNLMVILKIIGHLELKFNNNHFKFNGNFKNHKTFKRT
jgi:hypothetical protein